MPADPDELDAIAATVADVYREAETALVRTVARHLAGNADAPGWVTAKLGAVRSLRSAVQAILAALQADSSRAFAEAASTAFRTGWNSVAEELPRRWFPESGLAEASARAVRDMPGYGFVEALAEAVHRDVGQRHSNILRDTLDAYRSVIAAASGRVLTGTQTRLEASQAAWRTLRRRGIASFVDRSGRRWQLSSYVEMAARTVTQRAAVTGQIDRLDTLGVHLVMVSNAPRECPLCRPFEGRILRTDDGPTGWIRVPHATRDGETVEIYVEDTLDGARARGFQHPNCRHSVSAYLPGVSRLPERDTTADPEGYKAQQQQRALERAIRTAKTDLVGVPPGDEHNAARKSATRDVRAAESRLREHLAANPQLKRLRYREQIGAGNIQRNRDDAAGSIAPTMQASLDGTVERVRRAPREDPVGVEVEAPVVDERQVDIFGEPGRIADALAAGRRKPADLTDDELRLADEELASRAAQLGKPGQVSRAHKAVRDEIEQRNARPAPEPEEPAAVSLPDLTEVSDEDLDELLAEWADDDQAVEEILTELDRRQAEAVNDPIVDEPVADDPIVDDDQDDPHHEQWDHYEQLLSKGWTEENAYAEAFGKDVERLRRDDAISRLRAEGYKGKGLDELARAAWRDEVYRLYMLAEDATRGHLVTPDAQRRGVDPLSLFTGPAHVARANASDELKEWWDINGRPTYDQWVEQLLGRGPGYTGSAGDSWLQ